MGSNRIPPPVADYLNKNFNSAHLCEIKTVMDPKGRFYYLLELQLRCFVFRLRFDESGNFIERKPANYFM